MLKAILAALAIMFVCIGAFLFLDPSVNVQNPQNHTATTIQDGSIQVTIRGEIVNPGEYIIEEGATLGDLIELAGGTTEKADSQAFLLSCPLVHGKSYYIAPKVESTDVCEPVVIVKVNINTADQEELMSVQGIGSTIARAIIDYREMNGPFQCLEDLMNVQGIGNATFERIKNYISLS